MNNTLKTAFTAAIATLSVTSAPASPAVAEDPGYLITIIADLWRVSLRLDCGF